ncbi:hypothetical protein MLD38_018624 [Melastoma candidum]|uniref:Uncharacterized protein n=1 Tax=Melastoma candidum TaxID=119954 RepID=A0ACB9QTU3_9MYRT|nr:hypothetical protein MLD38_018624 [Melastoma candidum]
MSREKGCVQITIPQQQGIDTGKPVSVKGMGKLVVGWVKARAWSFRDFCKEDPNRVIYPIKVGIAVLLVSLFSLFRMTYTTFGSSIILSITTVVIMFEYTTGATFSRGFNRALGSLPAGILAITVSQIALSAGRVAQPFIIGISIFVTVNVLVFPIWAGELLHKEIVKSFNSVADALEGTKSIATKFAFAGDVIYWRGDFLIAECVEKYIEDDGLDCSKFSETVMDEFPNEPAYRRCRATLNSSAKLAALAQAAKWEPRHGRFRHLFYPWQEYIKVGAVLRYCAYEVMALHGVLHSEIRAPHNLRVMSRLELQDTSNQAAELVRSLGKDISSMKQGMKTSLLNSVHGSAKTLQIAIDTPRLRFTLEPKPKWNCSLGSKQDAPLAETAENPHRPYHETMKKQLRRLYSWPSGGVNTFQGEGDPDDEDLVTGTNAVESIASQSLATFRIPVDRVCGKARSLG